jgi:hypothetical protein
MRTLLVLTVGGYAVLSAGMCPAAEPSRPGPCVDVQVGTEHVSDLDCINQTLRTMTARQQAVPQLAPIDTRSSSPAVGTANQAAAQQMMGDAFGKSAQPQRPHPTFVTPLPGVPAAH